MEILNFEEMESLNGGNFFDGFCGAVAFLSTGAGVYILATGAVVSGGAVAWAWGGTVAACGVYAAYQLATNQ